MVKRSEKVERADGATDVIAFGSGCFWCSEAAFTQLKGVVTVQSGYAGGEKKNPSYEEVCRGTTGHAEVVRVEYDPTNISLDNLLGVFFTIHDPTTYNRQGYDVGTQYRSIVLYSDEEQKNQVKKYIAKLAHQKLWKDPIVTEVVPLEAFYPAEADHYRYYEMNKESRYCQLIINPKLEKLRQKYGSLLR